MQLLRKLAFPIALLYGLIIRIRNFCYDSNILASKSFSTPTICIGNLSVGGTGKTPMVEFVIRLFGNTTKLAVLSRGYRRRTRGFVLANEASTALQIGDEPLQLYHNFPEITVAVDSDRQRGISRLEEVTAPDMIILDDAFQHRRVRPDIALLLTAYGALYADDFFLPAGNLRDSKREARRADLIIVTKCPAGLTLPEQGEIKKKLRPEGHQQVLFAYLEYDPVMYGNKGRLRLEELMSERFLLVTGIANPGPLKSFLKDHGLQFEHKAYPDHHYFTKRELEEFSAYPFVLTTEKDYRRIGFAPDNLYFTAIRHKFLGNGASVLEERLKAL